ncbi:hypothetical protein B0H13DRAFT_1532479, partial [Mycena leptocephala]
PHPDSPYWIAHWVNQACDVIDVDGKSIPPQQVQSSYGTAQKMRAALSYTFGTVHSHGRTPWHKSETSGQWVGNPSISNLVGDYLPSLRRRKVFTSKFKPTGRPLTLSF